ncbi:MAG: xylose isomerase, partial [Oligoflexia bacterium]|nr:xylose isomerase [Oligoflexia bacterium]
MSDNVFIGNREYFKGIGKIKYEGNKSDNPLSYKFYDENKMIGNKSMKDHMRVAVAYWHTFCGDGGDPFGLQTHFYPWFSDDSMQTAINKVDAAFEFFTKLGIPYYCFHDRDIAPEGATIPESERSLEEITSMLKQRQKETGVKLLWNTANLTANPRYMNGASTNPDFNVLTYAAAQVKKMLDINVELDGENYVFWGGREGYSALINTNTKRELEHFGQFLVLCRDYGRKIGYKGPFLVEPKPMEPSKHQYDFDASTVIGFLRRYGLEKDFKLNIEANHATLAGHAFEHELQICADNGMLGSIDANRGDPHNGWDTDQYSTDIYQTTLAMMVVLENGGLGNGGLNLDAKIRRNSTDLEDLFIGHIGAIDGFARGLEIANSIIKDGKISKMKKDRYKSFDQGEGADFEKGKLTLEDLHKIAIKNGEPGMISGKQE